MWAGMKGLRRVVVFGLLSNSLRMTVGATSVMFLISRGISLTELGLLKGLQACLILMLDIPLGYAADRWGRRRVLAMSSFATACWLGLTAVAEFTSAPFLWFCVAEAFGAFGIAAFSGAYSAVLLNTYREASGREDFENILGWYGKWQFMLMALAAFFGALIGGHASPSVWWAAAVGTCGLGLGARWLLPVDRRRTDARRSTMRADIGKVARYLLSTAGLLWIALGYIVLMLGYQVLLQFWQPIIAQGDMPSDSGWTYGLAFIVFLLAQSAASEVARRGLSRIKIWSVGSLALAFLGWLISASPDVHYVMMIAALACAFFAFKLIAIGLLSFVQRSLSPDLWATSESSLSTVMRLTFIVLLPLVGVSGGHGTPVTIVAIVAFLLLSALACIAMASREGHRKYSHYDASNQSD